MPDVGCLPSLLPDIFVAADVRGAVPGVLEIIVFDLGQDGGLVSGRGGGSDLEPVSRESVGCTCWLRGRRPWL